MAGQTGFPEGITFNRITGHLYVVDGQGGNKVSEYTVDGTWIQNFTINGASQDGLTFDPDRCSYWIFDSGPTGTDTVRHYDLDFVEMESFREPWPPASASVRGSRSSGTASTSRHRPAAVAHGGRVRRFRRDGLAQIDVCRVFADGFESGDTSGWSSATP